MNLNQIKKALKHELQIAIDAGEMMLVSHQLDIQLKSGARIKLEGDNLTQIEKEIENHKQTIQTLRENIALMKKKMELLEKYDGNFVTTESS